MTYLNLQSVLGLPRVSGHRAVDVDQLDLVVEALVRLNVVAFASRVAEAELAGDLHSALLTDAHA